MAHKPSSKTAPKMATNDEHHEKMNLPFAPNVLQDLPAIFDALHSLMSVPTPENYETIPANMAELKEAVQDLAAQSSADAGKAFVVSLSLDGGWSHDNKSGATCDVLYVSGIMTHGNVGTNFQFTSHPKGKGVRFCYDEKTDLAYFGVGYLPCVACFGAMVSEEWFQMAKDDQGYAKMLAIFVEAVDLFLCEKHETDLAGVVQQWGDKIAEIYRKWEENPLFGLPDGAEFQPGAGDQSNFAIMKALAIFEGIDPEYATAH